MAARRDRPEIRRTASKGVISCLAPSSCKRGHAEARIGNGNLVGRSEDETNDRIGCGRGDSRIYGGMRAAAAYGGYHAVGFAHYVHPHVYPAALYAGSRYAVP